MGIDKGNSNTSVIEFDLLYGIEYPSASGYEGGGNPVHWDYEIQATPTIVVITPDKAIAIHQIYPPNYDNLVDSIQQAGGILQPCTTTIPENEINNPFVIGPNPVKTVANIDLNIQVSGRVELSIFNLTGQKVYDSGPTFYYPGLYRLNVDLSREPEGFYFVQYQNEFDALHTKKIIITK